MGRLMRTASDLVNIDENHALDMDIVRGDLEMYFPVGGGKDYTARSIEDYNLLPDLLRTMKELNVDVTMFNNVDHIFYFNGRDDFNHVIQKLFSDFIIDPYDFFGQLTSSSINTNHHWVLVTADDKIFTHGDELDKLFEEAYGKAVSALSDAAQNGFDAFNTYYNNMPYNVDDAIVQQ